MRNPQKPRKRRTLRSETYGKGSIYQDAKGRWWYQPPAKDGQRLPRQRAASESAARLAQRDHLAKLEQGAAVSGIPTVKEWFALWLREYVAPGLEESTIAWYRYLIEHYILPAIGDMLMTAVTSDHCIKLQNQLRQHLALRTVARVHEMLYRACKKAMTVTPRIILHNPMEAVERPRVPRSPQKAMQPEHEAAFRGTVAGHRLEMAYDLMLLQGFRRGETLALLISEYDKDRGVLRVSGQVQTVTGKTRRKGKTKSDAGVREVPITPRQQRLLDAHLDRLAGERSRLGVEWKEHGLLFPSERGTPIIPRNFNRHYDQTQEKAAIPHYTLHATRHTAATRFDAVGVTRPQQQAIMGHSPGSVTDGYIHPAIRDLLGALLLAEREMLKWAA